MTNPRGCILHTAVTGAYRGSCGGDIRSRHIVFLSTVNVMAIQYVYLVCQMMSRIVRGVVQFGAILLLFFIK